MVYLQRVIEMVTIIAAMINTPMMVNKQMNIGDPQSAEEERNELVVLLLSLIVDFLCKALPISVSIKASSQLFFISTLNFIDLIWIKDSLKCHKDSFQRVQGIYSDTCADVLGAGTQLLIYLFVPAWVSNYTHYAVMFVVDM